LLLLLLLLLLPCICAILVGLSGGRAVCAVGWVVLLGGRFVAAGAAAGRVVPTPG